MNKTIIININGIVFHIEEDAYEILKNYMTDVKRHFMNSADSLEITTDIENRIAEMFNELLANEHKQVITDPDVRQVIAQMGTVEDFEVADDATENNFAQFTRSGMARRLFRNPDDHLIGGVCAGIANYFDVQPVWIRLAFAITLFFAGTGLLLYIILWAVVPKAASRADRMAMKGERLDLRGFKKNFEEEMSGLRGNLSDFSNEARPFVYKTRDFIGDFFYHLGDFLRGAGKILVKVFGVAILACSIGALIALIVAVIGFVAFNNYGLYQVFPFNIVNHEISTAFLICGFLVLSIPVLTIILATFGGIFNVGGLSRSTGTTMLIIWLLAVGIVIYNAAKVATQFRDGAKFTRNFDLKPTANNTYYVKLNDARYFTGEDSVRYKLKEHFNGHVIIDDDDEYRGEAGPENVHLNIERSDIDKPVLIETFSARGADYEQALANASGITYHYTQTDTILTFDRRFQKPLNKLWRQQELFITLKLPKNAKVIIDQNVADHIGGADVRGCNYTNKHEDANQALFTITDNGLQCKVDTLPIKRDSLKTDSVVSH